MALHARVRRALRTGGGFQVPPDWEAGAPDFVGVGVQKAGTSWWYALLAEHPEVDVRAVAHKELHFFDDAAALDLAEELPSAYAQEFRRPRGKRCGEWTPRYCFDPWSLDALHGAAPGAAVLLALRDPVARCRSGVEHAIRRGTVLSAALITEHIQRSDYLPQVARAQDLFGDAVLVLQLERMAEDTRGEYRRTLQHLGLSPFDPPSRDQPRNVGSGDRWQLPVPVARAIQRRAVADADELAARCPALDLTRWPSLGRSK